MTKSTTTQDMHAKPLRLQAPLSITTKRLYLRPWQQADYAPFATINADAQVMECFPRPLTTAESNALAQRITTGIQERGWGLWAVGEQEGDPFIGFVGLHIPRNSLPFSPCVEIGWRLATKHWGKGYAPEAAAATLAVAFHTLELDEVVAFTSATNVRSRRVMEKIGLISTAEDFDHPDVPTTSPLRRHVLYRLNRNHYLQHHTVPPFTLA